MALRPLIFLKACRRWQQQAALQQQKHTFWHQQLQQQQQTEAHEQQDFAMSRPQQNLRLLHQYMSMHQGSQQQFQTGWPGMRQEFFRQQPQQRIILQRRKRRHCFRPSSYSYKTERNSAYPSSRVSRISSSSSKLDNYHRSQCSNCSWGSNRCHTTCGSTLTPPKRRRCCSSKGCSTRSRYVSSRCSSSDSSSRNNSSSSLSKIGSNRCIHTSTRSGNISDTSPADGDSSCLISSSGHYRSFTRSRSSNSRFKRHSSYLAVKFASARLGVFAKCLSHQCPISRSAYSFSYSTSAAAKSLVATVPLFSLVPLRSTAAAASQGIAAHFYGQATGILHCLSAVAAGVLADSDAAYAATAAVPTSASTARFYRTAAVASLGNVGKPCCKAGDFIRGGICPRPYQSSNSYGAAKNFISHVEAAALHRGSVARFIATIQARAFRLGKVAAKREEETLAAEATPRPVAAETSLGRRAAAAAGKRNRQGAHARRYAEMKGGPAATGGQELPDATGGRGGEETLAGTACARGGGEGAEKATAAADLTAGTGSAARARRVSTAVNSTTGAVNNSGEEAIDTSDERETYEPEDMAEYVDSGEIFVNPLCTQMEQLLLQCGTAEEVLTLLVSHRGVLFVKNLITALELLAQFANPSAAAEGVGVQNNSSSFSTSTSQSSNGRRDGSTRNRESNSRSGQGSCENSGSDCGDSSRDGESSKDCPVTTRESSSANCEPLRMSSANKETDLIDQGVLGRYLEGPMPRGWPRARMSYRELFSYLKTEEEPSRHNNSSNSTPWRGLTRTTGVRQPLEASWIVRDERYEVLLDDLRLHRRCLSFDAAARVVLALRRLNHRHYGLLSAMLHPLAKRGIPMPPTASAPKAATAVSQSTSIFSPACPTSAAATAPSGKRSLLSSAAAFPTDAAVEISHISAQVSDLPGTACCPQSAAAVPHACGEGRTLTQQQLQQQEPTEHEGRRQPQQPPDFSQVARLQKRFEQATHARMQQLLQCADVYVWAGYTQHPFFDRVVRLVSAALRPRLHVLTKSYILAAAAAARDDRDAKITSTVNDSVSNESTAAARTSTGEMLISVAPSAESRGARMHHPTTTAVVNIATADVQSAAADASAVAAAGDVAVPAIQRVAQSLWVEGMPACAAGYDSLGDVKFAPTSTQQLGTRKTVASAVAAAQLGNVLTNSPTLLVDCLRVFSSLQISHAEHAHVAAAAAQLLLSDKQCLFFTLSPDETAALAAAIAGLPPLLHLLPCMRTQVMLPRATLNSQQLLHEPSPSPGVLRLENQHVQPQLPLSAEASKASSHSQKERPLPLAHQRHTLHVVQVEQHQQGRPQHLNEQHVLLHTFEPQQRPTDVEGPQQQLPGMPQEQQEPLEMSQRQKKDEIYTTQLEGRNMRQHACVNENHVEALAEGNVETSHVNLSTRESIFQHPTSAAEEDRMCHYDSAKTSPNVSDSQPLRRPVVDPSGAGLLFPVNLTACLSAQNRGALLSRREREAAFSSVVELLAQQTGSPVHALLRAAADHLEGHFPAFSLTAIASLLSSFQRQQLLFPLCILRSAGRAATHLRLAANTCQRAHISVDEVGRLLHSCTFFGLAILSQPAKEKTTPHRTFSDIYAAASNPAVPLLAAGDGVSTSSHKAEVPTSLFASSAASSSSSDCSSSSCVSGASWGPSPCARATAVRALYEEAGGRFSSHKRNVTALPGWHTNRVAFTGSATSAAEARAAAEEVSAAAAAVTALCDSAAAYLEQHLDEITETTAIRICYALVAVKGATAQHRYLLSHVYRKIGKGTAWEKHRALIFELWLSQLIQFPSLSYNMPRRCVFEGLRAWCMQRGGYGAPWPEEVAEISSLLHCMCVRHHAFAYPQRGGPYEIDILLQAPNLESTAILVTTESAKNAFEPAGSTALQQQHLFFLAGITRVACVNRGVWKNLPTRASKLLLLLQILQWLSFWAEKKSTAAASKTSTSYAMASA